MSAVLAQPWLFWALGVAVGLPLGLILLTEVQQALTRRGSALARPVALTRTYLLPLGALLVLLVGANQVSPEVTGVRIVATLFGFAVLLLVLSGFNATVFENAPVGSWRKRMPAIFLEVARLAVIAVGLAVILSYVWGANVGGLFTALGITSIVLGLALQNSVGQIISGLLLLFEQPFELGDWIETTSTRGQVIEVNWRATHIRTGTGIRVIPNSVLAAAEFKNLSRPVGVHTISVETVFALSDPPDRVCAVLTEVAGALPNCRDGAAASSVAGGGNTYSTVIPLRSPADAGQARTLFLRWLWYAARRAGLHLDERGDDLGTEAEISRALATLTPILRLTPAEADELRPHLRLARYGAEETLQAAGAVPERLVCLLDGRVQLTVSAVGGAVLPAGSLTVGGCLGQTTLTREPARAAARALVETTVVEVDREQLASLVHRKPALLQDLARSIEEQREGVQRALTASGR